MKPFVILFFVGFVAFGSTRVEENVWVSTSGLYEWTLDFRSGFQFFLILPDNGSPKNKKIPGEYRLNGKKISLEFNEPLNLVEPGSLKKTRGRKVEGNIEDEEHMIFEKMFEGQSYFTRGGKKKR